MSTQTMPGRRPVGVDELKRAWTAVASGDFRAPRPGGAARGVRSREPSGDAWTPAEGEHTIAVLGCAGSAGTSTLALAIGLAAAAPVRVVETCSVSASGLAAASTAELGVDPTGWRQGKRDHVLLERGTEILTSVDQVPVPVPAATGEREQLTILDIGWEVGHLLATDCWLTTAVRDADQLVLATTATVPGMRRLESTLELLSAHWQPEQIRVAVRGPRRKKWPRPVEHCAGPTVRRALSGDRHVEIPDVRELTALGLDSRPVPPALVTAARQLLDPTHLPATDPNA